MTWSNKHDRRFGFLPGHYNQHVRGVWNKDKHSPWQPKQKFKQIIRKSKQPSTQNQGKTQASPKSWFLTCILFNNCPQSIPQRGQYYSRPKKGPLQQSLVACPPEQIQCNSKAQVMLAKLQAIDVYSWACSPKSKMFSFPKLTFLCMDPV